MKDFKRVVVIQSMVSTDEFVDKLEKYLAAQKKKFRIG